MSTWAGPTMPRSLSNIPLEALGEALLFDGMRPVRGPTLAAGLSRREDLAGVAEIARVESLAQAPHKSEIGLGEDQGHVVYFLQADAVLARDGAADVRDARVVPGDAQVVEDVRMQVAAAGVEDLARAEPVRRDDVVDAPQNLG